MSYSGLLLDQLEKANLQVDFEDEDRFWIRSYFEDWSYVASLVFIHKGVSIRSYLAKVSRFSSYKELYESDNKTYWEHKDELSTAAYIIVALHRLIYAANDNDGWLVATIVSDIHFAQSNLPDWKHLFKADFNEIPIEGLAYIPMDEIIAANALSERARQSARAKHKETYQIKEKLREWHLENRHEFLKEDKKIHQIEAAEHIRNVLRMTTLSAKKIAEYMSEFEKEYFSKRDQ